MTFYTMPLTDSDGHFTGNWDYYTKDPFGELLLTSRALGFFLCLIHIPFSRMYH